MGKKLTPKQVQRMRKSFLSEITPEWVEYEKKRYAIEDEFDEAIKDLHSPDDVPAYWVAFGKARTDKLALKPPKTWMWLPGKEPQIGDDWDRSKEVKSNGF